MTARSGRARLFRPALGLLLALSGCRSPAASRREAAPPVPEGGQVRVEVLNGCGVPGAADAVASRLRAANILVERTGSARELGYTRDLVIARTADPGPAALVAGCLENPLRLIQRNETADVDVTVIVGRPR